MSSPLPGMPEGKAAGVRCVNLDPQSRRCRIWGSDVYPDVCRDFLAAWDACGDSTEQALNRLSRFERETTPTTIAVSRE
ncbi:MAG: YkgJ family cysteine cluster protein [Pseudomonadota bacterium]